MVMKGCCFLLVSCHVTRKTTWFAKFNKHTHTVETQLHLYFCIALTKVLNRAQQNGSNTKQKRAQCTQGNCNKTQQGQ